MKYLITEKQSLESVRLGEVIEAMNLAAAKRTATRRQSFQGTVLTIEQGNKLLAYKQHGKWHDIWDNDWDDRNRGAEGL